MAIRPVPDSALAPADSPDDIFARALSAHRGGEYASAVAGYRHALSVAPGHIDARGNLGVAYQAMGRLDDAVECYRTALASRPDLAPLWLNLGAALKEMGHLGAAQEALRRAIEREPESSLAYLNLGNVQRADGRPEDALEAYERAHAIAPDQAAPLSNRGLAQKDLGQYEDARASFEAALLRAPEDAEVHFNLGNTLRTAGRLADAEVALRHAIEFAPGHAAARSNLGMCLRDQGKLDAGIEAFDGALRITPDYADAQWNRALTLLLGGNYKQGWPAYEWRFKATGLKPRQLLRPQWEGAPLEGRTVLLHAEQGLGDTLQFVRFAHDVRARGGRVVIECQAPLVTLLRGASDVAAEVLPCGADLPHFDLHAPLMSLPAILGMDHIPAQAPYLKPPREDASSFDSFLETPRGIRRVAIAWAGNAQHENDRNRSCAPHHFAALAHAPSITLFSLQKNARAEALEKIGAVRDIAPALEDFADTARVLARLDLVITVDTALAHLAGAMGRPVWLLLPFAPDWRWGLGQGTTPWYSSMRLFRQSAPGDWKGVIGRVTGALEGGV